MDGLRISDDAIVTGIVCGAAFWGVLLFIAGIVSILM
jgi:hypothetical protein